MRCKFVGNPWLFLVTFGYSRVCKVGFVYKMCLKKIRKCSKNSSISRNTLALIFNHCIKLWILDNMLLDSLGLRNLQVRNNKVYCFSRSYFLIISHRNLPFLCEVINVWPELFAVKWLLGSSTELFLSSSYFSHCHSFNIEDFRLTPC